jgi:hypothetical protein
VRRLALVAIVALSISGCGRASSPAGEPPTAAVGSGSAIPYSSTSTTTPPTTATPAVDNGAIVWQLRYKLLDHYPSFAYCDPDLYPVARDDEQAAADTWWASADHASPETSTILQHFGYHEPLASSQRLSAYRDHKKLTVITMTAVRGGFQYELSTSSSGGSEPDQTVTGTITDDGFIHETGRQARRAGCPICLEAGTSIATPYGDVTIALIRAGDVVWTTDSAGRRVPGVVERVVRRPTPGPHLMLQLVLSDGRRLLAAGAHPAADGTYLRQLQPGQGYDGATIISANWVTSTASATFDILPAGPTGTYWANDVLIGSTLER